MVKPVIIDIHCHTAGIGAGDSGCFVSPALRRSWKYQFYLKAFGVTEKELAKSGDSLVIDRLARELGRATAVQGAVILALDGVIDTHGRLDLDNTDLYVPNDFVARETSKHPNLLFGASINPNRYDALDELDRASRTGAVLIKWLPAIQHIDPADKRFIPFYRRLAELGLPLLCHTGEENSFTYSINELGDPDKLRLPLAEGVTVIAAHAASSGRNHRERNHDRFLRLCREFPNLYADISSLTQVNRLGHLPRLLRHHELHGRLLYGTDMPLLCTGITSPLLHAYRLPPAMLCTIMSLNNPWDRDVALKKGLGVTEQILANSADLLGLANKVFTLSGQKDQRDKATIDT